MPHQHGHAAFKGSVRIQGGPKWAAHPAAWARAPAADCSTGVSVPAGTGAEDGLALAGAAKTPRAAMGAAAIISTRSMHDMVMDFPSWRARPRPPSAMRDKGP